MKKCSLTEFEEVPGMVPVKLKSSSQIHRNYINRQMCLSADANTRNL